MKMVMSESSAQKRIDKLGCQYMGPDQDPREPVKYCGKPNLPGKSYCAEHYPMMYQTGTATSKKKSAGVVAKKQHEWAPGELEDLLWECYEELITEGEIEA
jgi:hypothetical protein